MKKAEIINGVEYAKGTTPYPNEQVIVLDNDQDYEEAKLYVKDQGYVYFVRPVASRGKGMVGDVKGVLATEVRWRDERDEKGLTRHFATHRAASEAYSHLPASAVRVSNHRRRRLSGKGDDEGFMVALGTWEPVVVPRNQIRSTWADYENRLAEDRQQRLREERRKKREADAYDAWLASAQPLISALHRLDISAGPHPYVRGMANPPERIVLNVSTTEAAAIVEALADYHQRRTAS